MAKEGKLCPAFASKRWRLAGYPLIPLEQSVCHTQTNAAVLLNSNCNPVLIHTLHSFYINIHRSAQNAYIHDLWFLVLVCLHGMSLSFWLFKT